MDILTADLAEFEDPAPLQSNGVAEEPKNLKQDGSNSTRNKLPFRADIELSSKRYKGERKSRSDVELDTETLGILDDVDEEKPNEDDDSGNDSYMEEDESLNTEDSDSDEHDIPVGSTTTQGINSSQSKVTPDKEERAVLDRLRIVEKEEEDQAKGVRKQKVSNSFHFSFEEALCS